MAVYNAHTNQVQFTNQAPPSYEEAVGVKPSLPSTNNVLTVTDYPDTSIPPNSVPQHTIVEMHDDPATLRRNGFWGSVRVFKENHPWLYWGTIGGMAALTTGAAAIIPPVIFGARNRGNGQTTAATPYYFEPCTYAHDECRGTAGYLYPSVTQRP